MAKPTPEPVKPGKAYGYKRASTSAQQITLETQEDQIKRYFEYLLEPKGFTWGGWFEDAAWSGRKVPLADRPAGAKLAAAVEPGDIVLFAKLDRGFRNVRDLATTVDIWTKRGVGFVFLDLQCDTSTYIGRCMVQMFGAMAEFVASQIAENTRLALQQLKREGRPYGKAPIGMKAVGPKGNRRWVPDPEVLAMAEKVFEWRMQGWGSEKIYWHLVYSGVKKKNGQEWPEPTLRGLWYWIVKKKALEKIRAEEAAKKNGQSTPAPIQP